MITKDKISRSFSDIKTITHGDYIYLEGMVFTPTCCVRVFSQDKLTVIDFVLNGIVYSKTLEKQSTMRGLARLANKFVREMRND